MIGHRIGKRIGRTFGKAIGIGVDELGGGAASPMAGVTRDATSGWYMPATAGEWTTTFNVAGLSGKSALSSWNFGAPASGNVSDQLAAGNTLTVAGASWLYQQAVAGWANKAMTLPDAAANHNAQNTTTVPDIATTSGLLLLYILTPGAIPAASRRIHRFDSTTGAVFGVAVTTGVAQCTTQGAGGTTVNGASNICTNTVHIVALQVNVTTPGAFVFTDQDKIVGTVGTYAGLAVGVGSSGGTSAAIGYLWGGLLTGANAELTSAQFKALFQTLTPLTMSWS